MSATIPFVWVDVSADVDAGGSTVRRSDKEAGLGDIMLMPVMFNHHVSEDLNINSRIVIYAPGGDYEKGRLANPGRNYWTFEPLIGFMHLRKKSGQEASIFFGADFNTENPATDYPASSLLSRTQAGCWRDKVSVVV